MNRITYDIDMAVKLVKSKFDKNKFSEYDSLYVFTNENQKAYFDKLNMKQKDILTIAGSGDHIFESLIRSSKSVTAVDINALTPYYINLKEAAIKSLDINKFIDFLCIDNNYYNVFNEKIYNKIRFNLDEKSIIFWDALYSKFSGRKIRTSYLFHTTEGSYKFLKNSLSYFNLEDYKKLKNILLEQQEKNKRNNVFINDITNTNIFDNKKFDIILLSNIAHYIEQIYDKNHLENFKKLITEKLDTLLNNDGIICAAYLFWGYLRNERKMPLIERQSIRSKYLANIFEEWEIDNYFLNNNSKNYVLVYKKQD